MDWSSGRYRRGQRQHRSQTASRSGRPAPSACQQSEIAELNPGSTLTVVVVTLVPLTSAITSEPVNATRKSFLPVRTRALRLACSAALCKRRWMATLHGTGDAPNRRIGESPGTGVIGEEISTERIDRNCRRTRQSGGNRPHHGAVRWIELDHGAGGCGGGSQVQAGEQIAARIERQTRHVTPSEVLLSFVLGPATPPPGGNL